MRTQLLWLSLAACGGPWTAADGGAPAPTDPPAGPGSAGQGAPALVTPPPIDVLGADTIWATQDGQRLVKADTGLQWQSAEGEPPSDRVAPDAAVRAGGCSALVHVEQAWVPIRRTDPACAPSERAYSGVAPTMWSFPGGDIYTLLPGGAAWRHGPKRVFKTPTGRWSGSTAGEIVFGPSTYTSVPLDACHRVMVHTQTQAAYRATRSFPLCEPAAAPYAAFEWTAWMADSGTVLDVRDSGLAFVDSQDRPDPQRASVQVRGESVTIRTEAGVEQTLLVSGCTAVDGTSGERFTRTFPPCR
ncbi:MAG: hypothetical protein AB8H79_06630 [Myxococcota bacterium]